MPVHRPLRLYRATVATQVYFLSEDGSRSDAIDAASSEIANFASDVRVRPVQSGEPAPMALPYGWPYEGDPVGSSPQPLRPVLE